MRTKEEYCRMIKDQFQRSNTTISQALMSWLWAYKAREEEELRSHMRIISATLSRYKADPSQLAHRVDAIDLRAIARRAEAATLAWQAGALDIELPWLIRYTQFCPESERIVLEELADWCATQDKLIGKLKALEAAVLAECPVATESH